MTEKLISMTEKLISSLFMPNTKLSLSWDTFIFLVIWYNSLLTPVRIFIMHGSKIPDTLIYVDIVLDFVFVVDTILHFFRPIKDKDTGRTVTNLKEIQKKYVMSFKFYINAIACIPIIKTLLAPFLSENANSVIITYFNILRMVRMLHFPSQFQELKGFLSQRGQVNDSVFRMGCILFFSQLAMCIFGCIYFGWGTMTVIDDICPPSKDFTEEFLAAETWVAHDYVITDVMNPDICEDSSTEIGCETCPQHLFFIRSVYFLMQTLFTIGYGDSVVPSRSKVEMVLTCIFMIFGVFGYGLIIANMTSVLANLDVVNMRFRHEMDSLNRWLDFRSVPKSLKYRIEMHFTCLGRTQHGMLDDALFNGLPAQLSKDFHKLHLSLLQKVPFFSSKYRDTIFLSHIAKVLVRRLYPPGSHILYEGEKQRELIIIKSGRAEIYARGSLEPIGTLLVGDYIGDYQLIFGTVNQVGLRSPDFAEALVLTFHAFEEVMNLYQNRHFEFKRNGSNLRKSQDKGAIDTIENSRRSAIYNFMHASPFMYIGTVACFLNKKYLFFSFYPFNLEQFLEQSCHTC